MQKHTLRATTRKESGHKVKHIRKQGLLPATIYGKNIRSESVSVPLGDFTNTYDKAGETGLIELSLEGKVRPVLIHNVQKHPISGELLHAELMQVNLKEKVHTRVPIDFVGTAPAVSDKVGTLLELLDELEIEALPTDLPEKISVDVSGLAEVNQEIKVKDVTVPAGITVLTDKDVSLVRIGELITQEEEPEQPVSAPAEGETPATTGEPAQGEQSPAEEKSAE